MPFGTDITVEGPGADFLAVNGSNAGRVFHVTAGTAGISGLTVTNGSDTTGGGVQVDSGATLGMTDCSLQGNASSSDNGGGVYNSGDLTLTECSIAGNMSADEGGGVFNEGGVLRLFRCTVSGNTAADFSGGLGVNGGTVTLVNCTVFGNTGNSHGGGGMDLYNSADVTLTSCTVTGNASPGAGGILKEDATLTMQADIVAENTTNATLGTIIPDIQSDSDGAFLSNGSNLIGDDNGGPDFTGAHDQVGTAAAARQPRLDPGRPQGQRRPDPDRRPRRRQPGDRRRLQRRAPAHRPARPDPAPGHARRHRRVRAVTPHAADTTPPGHDGPYAAAPRLAQRLLPRARSR